MIIFSILVCVFTLSTLVYLWHSVRRKSTLQQYQKALNIDIAKARLAELEHPGEDDKQSISASLAHDLKRSESKPVYRHANTHLTVIFITMIVSASFVVYWQIGQPLNTLSNQEQSISAESSEVILEKMQAYIAQNPNDIKGMSLLANAYFSQGQIDKAKHLFMQIQSVDENALLLDDRVKLARIWITQNNDQYTEDAKMHIEYVINNAKVDSTAYQDALFISGIAENTGGNQELAIQRLQLLADTLSTQSDLQQSVQQIIAQIKQQNSNTNLSLGRITISIDETQQAYINDNLTNNSKIFVIIRSDELDFPVAVTNLNIEQLPFTLELNDALSMQPNHLLSNYPEVSVEARLSITGQTIQRKEDLISDRYKLRLPTSKTEKVEIKKQPD